ncbi:YhjD/YihY/BrkB family envelope integrity protein [Mycoplasmopsis bovirhinis]|uniref:Ribonuclease BN-like family n=1 Tax=Mycoplasmopsis bovirhinis TaxID=29553 RepID=A0A449ACP6_9BACT|nr:YhjD/YihY/BrkB family envelope integrity protein [Mycoplasmopsis bovirhinis]VEU62792.1 Ribonuclease BN-like family [Mycoplasmopsis bovirhinis]
MIFLKTKQNHYRKYIKLKKKKSHLRKFYTNIIYPDRLEILNVIYETILKYVILFFTTFLIWVKNDNDKIKRNKLVQLVYSNYNSKETGFVWISTIFYVLISFIPVIYIVGFLNLTINNSITPFKDYIEPFVRSRTESVPNNVFQYLFNSIVFQKFIPGGESYFVLDNQNQDAGFNTFFSLIPGSFIAIPSLYIAAGGYVKVISAYNFIFGNSRTGSFFGNKVKGLWLVIVISILLWIFSNIFIFTEVHLWTRYGGINNWLSDFIYLIYVLVFLIVLFLVLFKLIPSFKIKFKELFKGTIVATLPSFVLIVIYTYLNQLVSYTKFGSAAGFFFSISFFINWFIYFMFLGIIFNNAYYKSFVSSKTIPKRIYAFI